MKVGGTSGAGTAGAVAGGRRAAPASGFTPSGAGPVGCASAASPSAAVSTPGGVEALLAMQELDGPLERRRRAVSRGGRLLDGLDAVRLALLGGAAPMAALEGLQQAAREAREQAGEADLDGVLDAIDLRAQVELAKAQMARQAA